MRSCNTRAMGTLAERYRAWSAHRVPEHTQRLWVPSRVCAMLERDAGRKAHRTFAASSEIETVLSQINDPKQGARLVRAFLTDHPTLHGFAASCWR